MDEREFQHTIEPLRCKRQGPAWGTEYALSDIQKPMGLSTDTVPHTLPENEPSRRSKTRCTTFVQDFNFGKSRKHWLPDLFERNDFAYSVLWACHQLMRRSLPGQARGFGP